MNNYKSFFITINCFFSIICMCLIYYFYPRNVYFEYVDTIPIKNMSYTNADYSGVIILHNNDEIYRYTMAFNYETGVDSTYIYTFNRSLDFMNYDYVLSYHRKLICLKYSPYLRNKDTLYFDRKYPLIPTFDDNISMYIYVYKIKKNKRFRSVGP